MPHLPASGWWLRRGAGSSGSPLTRPTGLACVRPGRPAWSEPSPDAPGHGINHLPPPYARVARLARNAAGPRPERELRAPQRLFREACARARLQRQGRGARGAGTAAAQRELDLPLAARDPPRHVRACPARLPAQDLAPGPVRPRRLAVRLLRHERRPPDPRPRGPAQPRRRVGLGQRRDRVLALQPAQGRPLAGRGRDGAVEAAGPARAGALHPAGRAEDPLRAGSPTSPASRRVGPARS